MIAGTVADLLVEEAGGRPVVAGVRIPAGGGPAVDVDAPSIGGAERWEAESISGRVRWSHHGDVHAGAMHVGDRRDEVASAERIGDRDRGHARRARLSSVDSRPARRPGLRATIDWSCAATGRRPSPVPFSDLDRSAAVPRPGAGRVPDHPHDRGDPRPDPGEPRSRVDVPGRPRIGARYCPSIEDKVVRFADRSSHHVFLDPETVGGDSIYCNGISTSLPEEVQPRSSGAWRAASGR